MTHPRTGHASAFPPNCPRLRRYVTSRLPSNPGSEWHLSAAGAMLDMLPEEDPMPRFRDFVPHGVIPAALLPFDADLAIDEAGVRPPLGDPAGNPGVTPAPLNAHSTEGASCQL